MSGIPTWTRVQLRMGKWIEQGKPMPIPDINHNMSHRLLCHVVGRDPHPQSLVTKEMYCKMEILMGPHGYAYFRMLLAKRGEFVIPEKCLAEFEQFKSPQYE